MVRIKPYYGVYSYIRIADINIIHKSINTDWSYITVKGIQDDNPEIYMEDKEFDNFLVEFEKENKKIEN